MLRRYILLIILLGVYACGGQGGQNQEKGSNTDPEQKFFSKDNSGIWKDYREDHDIQVKVVKEKYRKVLQVSIPLKVTPEHYIEVILLQDYKGKELEAKSFKRGQSPTAEFSVPAGFQESVTIISKCNLHDMWVKKVNLAD